MLENFLILIGKNEEDLDLRKVNYILEKSKRAILKEINFTEDKLDETLMDIIVELAIYRYNLLGLEATNSESYNGTAFSYSLAIPQHIYSQLDPYKRRLRVI